MRLPGVLKFRDMNTDAVLSFEASKSKLKSTKRLLGVGNRHKRIA